MKSLEDERDGFHPLWWRLLAVVAIGSACRECVYLWAGKITVVEAVVSGLISFATAIGLLWLVLYLVRRSVRSEQDRLRESLILLDIATAVGSTIELQKVLQVISRRTAQACDVHRCSIFLLEKDRILPLMSQRASGETDRIAWETFRRRTYTQTVDEIPILAQVLEDRLPLVLNSSALTALPGEWTQPFDVQSLMVVPLVTRDTVIGFMALDQVESKGFSRKQVNLAATIGSQAAAALENARLHQQTVDDNRKLKELDRLKSEIVANVSHELRSPLASIKAYTELLLDEAPAQKSDVYRGWLQVIDRETDLLTGLVNDSLGLSRLEAGRFELMREPLDLGALVREGVALLQVQARSRRVVIGVDASPDLPLLWADPELIRSMVRNLVGNAVKFSHDGGRVSIDVWGDAGLIKLSVQDEGVGIPEEAIPFLFTKFYRVPASTEVQGTGLGLALVKEAVAAHGGEIQVESTVGKGSRFVVSMPAGRAPPVEQD